jgi:CelD/BcsL family acetyltransferase involved in cellulose biosynthesis
MLRADLISQLSSQDRLVEEWSELADACPQATIFQTPEWLATWWSFIGQKRLGCRLRIIAIRDDTRLVGLAPLMESSWYGLPFRRLSFLAAGSTDYNDAIALPGREDEVCEAIFGHLLAHPMWWVLDFKELRVGGLLRDRPPLRSSGLVYSDWPLEACPYLTLPTDGTVDERWAKLLAGYSKKTRGKIGYYERNLTRTFRVDMNPVADEAELPAALEDLFELHRRRWNKRWLPGVFSSATVRSFHVAAARRLLAKGRLRLHVLKLDGDVQAVLYAFAHHDRTCYYQGGFEPEFARYSLGTVLIASAIRQAISEGYETFDFLRGNEEYKGRWTLGAHHVNIRRLVCRSGAALAAADRIHAVENRIEERIKDLFAAGIVHRAEKRGGKADDGE